MKNVTVVISSTYEEFASEILKKRKIIKKFELIIK